MSKTARTSSSPAWSIPSTATSATPSTAVGGLTPGTLYQVLRLDFLRIKLLEVSNLPAPLYTFDDGDLSGNTININGHGFLNGQAVTYRAPGEVNFNTVQVDEVSDTIRLGPDHGLSDGDKLLYFADGPAIGGLVNGQRYYVIETGDPEAAPRRRKRRDARG